MYIATLEVHTIIYTSNDCALIYLMQIKRKEARLRTRKMKTEYCQPRPRSLDTIIGRHTPAIRDAR